jgi:hypothetical protein
MATPSKPVPGGIRPVTQASPLPRPGAEDPAVAKAIAAGKAGDGFRPSGIALFIALGCLAGIAMTQNTAGTFDKTAVLYTAILGGGAVFVSLVVGVLVQRVARRSATVSNNAFVLAMIFTGGAAVLARGPVHAQAVDKLNRWWPEAATLLTKVEQYVPQMEPPTSDKTQAAAVPPAPEAAPEATAAPATKGAPVVRVRRAPAPTVNATPTSEPR